MSVQKGKFIVFEGIDGCGKSTQAKEIKRLMDEKKIPTHLTREASDGPIGKLLRSEYLSGKRVSDPKVINLLYPADRLDHITNQQDGMLTYINYGTHVLCDRYYMSTMAYYSAEYYGLPDFTDELLFSLEINKHSRELMIPDVTIFIEVDPEIALERIREERDISNLAIYETSSYLDRVAQTYQETIRIMRLHGDKIYCINGNQPKEQITKTIISLISEFIPEIKD